MYELKKDGEVLTSKFVGTGLSSYKKRIYRAAVSQRLRNIDVTEPSRNFCIPSCEASNWPKNTLKLHCYLAERHLLFSTKNNLVILFRKKYIFILRAITNTAWREGAFSMLQQAVNIVTTVFFKVKWQIFVVACKKQTLFLLPYLSFF
jgi:hypothetical protein